MKQLILLSALVVLIIAGGCKKEDDSPPASTGTTGTTGGTVTDIDGNVYNTIVIDGTLEIMTENLRTTKYANGDPIPNVIDANQWSNLNNDSTGAWCHYDNDSQYENPYGKLYNWYAVDDSRNVCPSGWHVSGIPISMTMGNEGGKAKATGTIQAGTGLWEEPNMGATNSTGFTGLPGGWRNSSGTFSGMGYYGYWWLPNFFLVGAWAHFLLYSSDDGGETIEDIEMGFCVRCAKD